LQQAYSSLSYQPVTELYSIDIPASLTPRQTGGREINTTVINDEFGVVYHGGLKDIVSGVPKQ